MNNRSTLFSALLRVVPLIGSALGAFVAISSSRFHFFYQKGYGGPVGCSFFLYEGKELKTTTDDATNN